MSVPPHLETLNPQQREAAETLDGPLLILAGAGAGKTKTLTHRIINLIHHGVDPSQILAITFTNKAAREMRERIHGLIENDTNLRTPVSEQHLPFASTFHALGAVLLRTYSSVLPVTRSFSILDRNDSIRLIKDALSQHNYDPKQYQPQRILGRISREKGNNVDHVDFGKRHHASHIAVAVADTWKTYEALKQKSNALDFDDLLLLTARILRDHDDIRDACRARWSHIHIDEYQDTNVVQNDIAHLLTGDAHNICVVGDIDQNIYSWRGAQLKNILDFETTFPEARTIILEENYRSTQTILTAANQVIAKNVHRKEKNLFTKNTAGEPITCAPQPTENHEARYIARTAHDLIRAGIDPNEIAVLYRANFQSRVLEEACMHEGIPYQMLGTRFFERKEIKDVIAFVRLALNPDNVADLTRVINVPTRGIGKTTLARIVNNREDELTPALAKRVADFRALLAGIAEHARTKPVSDTIKYTMDKTGIVTDLKKEGEGGLERIENLRELVTLATKYDALPPEEGIERLLEDAALASDQDELSEPRDGIKLMTVHAAKGLEFSYVFICGLEDGLFPHTKYDENLSPEEEEEERRLFYVALTRARSKVFLTYAHTRTIFGSQTMALPSEFITDIDDDLFETSDEPEFETGSGGLLGYPGDDNDSIIYL